MIHSIWNWVKIVSIAFSFSAITYFTLMGIVITIDRLVVDRASAGCAKGSQHGTE